VVVQAVRPLAKPITLDMIKSEPCLQHLPLIKQSRLSVMPIDSHSWDVICDLSSIK
jgi:predicted RNA-binding protein with PUA-like domain